MNEQLQLALKDILEKALASLDTAVDFLSGQIPIVVHEVLVWNLVYNLVLFVVAMTILVVVPLLWWKKRESMMEYCDDGFNFTLLSAVIFAVPAMIVFACMNLEWLKIWLAPRLWLVEYAANLVK